MKTLLGERRIAVSDIGANPLDGGLPPYRPLMENQLCDLTGFEPQAAPLARLLEMAGPHETYLPYALGDGKEHTLKLTPASGMVSFLPPDYATHGIFEAFRQWGKVIGTHKMQTYRLDDLEDLTPPDFLKIDVQGFELEIFRNGENKLKDCVVIHTEVCFISLYENMPTIGELDVYLRSRGYIPHCIQDIHSCIISPMVINNDPRIPMRQVLYADMVYVKDFRYAETFSDDQLIKLAAIAHYCYKSWDLAARCIQELQKRSSIPGDSLQSYFSSITRARERERERERGGIAARARRSITARERHGSTAQVRIIVQSSKGNSHAFAKTHSGHGRRRISWFSPLRAAAA